LKDTVWVISNIAAGPTPQVATLFKTKHGINLIRKVADLACDAKWPIRQEALWALAYMVVHGNDSHVSVLADTSYTRAMEAFSFCFKNYENVDVGLLLKLLEALDKILKRNVDLDLNFIPNFTGYDGVEHMEGLQQHESEDVFQKVQMILIEHFQGDDDGENFAPDVNVDGTFGFDFPKHPFPAENELSFERDEPLSSLYHFNFGDSPLHSVNNQRL
jgi:Atypical Arm repeat